MKFTKLLMEMSKRSKNMVVIMLARGIPKGLKNNYVFANEKHTY